MKTILVTNDDGVRSEGIHVLAAALARLGEVTIVAPHMEASAIGHALTLRRPLRMEHLNDRVYEVDGTPTDCVNIAVTQLYPRMPDLVVSGINKGYNLGDDVTYSGTVAGAMEGALLGIPSLAVSVSRSRGPYDFGPAAAAAAALADVVLEKGLPSRVFLNINVPPGRPRGLRVTVQAKRNHVTVVSQREDPRNRAYYWIEEGQDAWEPHDQSDYQAVKDGCVSVTPMHPDLTAHAALAAAEELKELTARRRVEVE
ncbi:MAG: 5'/3'-nucleotidase SurE [Acidobacteria bacterium RIFCSPLOWO2_02_FULL_67_36]|nr:MAG: 5'/3'-nucleotidase SurE [Acidobacteria bacterium RIFCSPLOWO2_02_FULL_67_36]OFW23338.1 MAG: 5'/3'-nucleotidase SurE [Acidobacteria bacterium RIFCSPLOWO2_12_FULL_66_21]